ncbi:peptidase inhibitor family I36 protein [Nonomuraea sp. LP-02]|uniref:peptidase inhibitor family I36 protein n=1 Tax=Nonomuraea sp. LP-02 TaxID=3097960 RepID=UPI002E332A91|nr:peptidase inhibitor family I36 protein [Nonomuraea sp. LP-02]MED7930438.1 peptidase inhibitor family I36 protein [Nonomuraea sp. LP-02]
MEIVAQRAIKAVAIVTSVLVAFGAFLAGSPASAAPACGSGTFCIYKKANYEGWPFQITRSPSGTCETLGNPFLSFINNSTIEGYFYSSTSCSGSARAVQSGGRGNIGFSARSFKHACVSCRTVAPAR